jgi:hypothetical protein
VSRQEIRPCLQCGKPSRMTYKGLTRGWQLFCSGSCARRFEESGGFRVRPGAPIKPVLKPLLEEYAKHWDHRVRRFAKGVLCSSKACSDALKEKLAETKPLRQLNERVVRLVGSGKRFTSSSTSAAPGRERK